MWTAPRTYVTGELITAVIMNTDHRDNLIALKDSSPIKGMILPFSGTLGGTGNHFPVDPDTAVANLNWHICNGDTQNAVVTPDLRDRFVIAAGATYAAGASGGAATKNLAHTHAPGTLAIPDHSAHLHGVSFWSGGPDATQTVQSGAGADVGTVSHKHAVSGNTANASISAHGAITGASASGGSATQDIMPPYYSLSYICYVGS